MLYASPSLVPRLSPRPDENKNGGGEPGFTDSEVRHVSCDYVMHYSSVVRKRGSWRVRNTEKQGEGDIDVKLV